MLDLEVFVGCQMRKMPFKESLFFWSPLQSYAKDGFFFRSKCHNEDHLHKSGLGCWEKAEKNKENHVKCNYFDAFQFGMQTRASALNTDSKLHRFCKYHIAVPGKFLGIYI